MAVYSFKRIRDLESQVYAMTHRYISMMPLSFTTDEFIQAFILPQHVPKLRELEELVGTVDTRVRVSKLRGEHHDAFAAMDCVFQFYGDPPIAMPKYVRLGLQPECPDEIREKVTSWVNERLRIGYVFGDVIDALNWLNEECKDVDTMSLLLPCFPKLLASISVDEDSKTTKRARKLVNNKRVGSIPPLPRKIKNRLSEISSIANSVSLLADAKTPVPTKETVLIERYQGSSVTFSSERVNIFHADLDITTAPSATFI